jgi:putative nucleotidyltransferase with HDIG domain
MESQAKKSGARASVLVVDDEHGPRESLRVILSPFYEVNTVKNGSQAIDFIKNNFVGLVTLDLNMPGLPGIDVLRQIKKIDNNVDVVILTGYGTTTTATDAARFGAADFICKPFDIPEIFAAVRKCFERRTYNLQLKDFLKGIKKRLQAERNGKSLLNLVEQMDFGSELGELQKGLKDFFQQDQEKHGSFSQGDFAGFCRALARVAEKISCHPIGHAERVVGYCRIIAEGVLHSSADTENLAKAALLHDIGKIGGRPEPSEKVDPSRDELLYLRRHPLVGAYLTEEVETPPTVVSAIRHHHECWNGTGFPYGLAGNEIPPLARILALANYYDILASVGDGQGAFSLENIRKEIRKGRGTLFEPALTDRVLKRLADGPLPLDPHMAPL